MIAIEPTAEVQAVVNLPTSPEGDPGAVPFDYAALPPDNAAALMTCRDEIRARAAQGAESMIAIGRELLPAKGCAGHGHFLDWLAAEFAWSERTAQNYMRVATVFDGKAATVADLSPTAVYAL